MKRVVGLEYAFIPGEGADFSKSLPVIAYYYEDLGFSVSIVNNTVNFQFVKDVFDVSEAREIAGEFIEEWKIVDGINRNPGDFNLKFVQARLASDSGQVESIGEVLCLVDAYASHVERSQYPDFPRNFKADQHVKSMYWQYAGARLNRIWVIHSAFFCLSLFEAVASGSVRKHKIVDQHFNFSHEILDKIGDFTGRGGRFARKAHGHREAELTPKEEEWLFAAMRLMIRRAGERAALGSPPPERITIDHLPKLSGS
jgi:hypothetical protein